MNPEDLQRENEAMRLVIEELIYHLARYQARYHGAAHAEKPWEEAQEVLDRAKQITK